MTHRFFNKNIFMNLFQSIIIAIIEGITEFLPISSTAHMKFANPFLGIANTPFVDLFEIVIQLAAIASVVVVYYKKFFDFKHYSFYLKLIAAPDNPAESLNYRCRKLTRRQLRLYGSSAK